MSRLTSQEHEQSTRKYNASGQHACIVVAISTRHKGEVRHIDSCRDDDSSCTVLLPPGFSSFRGDDRKVILTVEQVLCRLRRCVVPDSWTLIKTNSLSCSSLYFESGYRIDVGEGGVNGALEVVADVSLHRNLKTVWRRSYTIAKTGDHVQPLQYSVCMRAADFEMVGIRYSIRRESSPNIRQSRVGQRSLEFTYGTHIFVRALDHNPIANMTNTFRSPARCSSFMNQLSQYVISLTVSKMLHSSLYSFARHSWNVIGTITLYEHNVCSGLSSYFAEPSSPRP